MAMAKDRERSRKRIKGFSNQKAKAPGQRSRWAPFQERGKLCRTLKGLIRDGLGDDGREAREWWVKSDCYGNASKAQANRISPCK